MKLGLVTTGIALTVLSVAACGARAATSGPSEISLEDYRYAPNRIDAQVGVPLSIRLVNRGAMQHDLTFQSLHMPGLAGVEAILQPGETRLITLTFDAPGTHAFTCTIPGHAVAGMTGAAFVRN